MNWEMYFKSLLSLVIWREARGEGHTGMRMVLTMIPPGELRCTRTYTSVVPSGTSQS